MNVRMEVADARINRRGCDPEKQLPHTDDDRGSRK